ncbi:glycosyltransferase [Actinocrinis puniceicyclus]|uniref:Glycosyltransferase n=1 Tax=Actinocrinis puniceicyclus TaxID=977794 RepID=A0A8J7WP40_9ACTN|nr:glycosyltransferase [Actinocrinis puniceicyclus]MBS2966046.1 glycosyltransferase [Actinocrinis puniceicyclus]
MNSRNPTSRPPRILYLAFFFPPSRSSGVYRARATARHLAAAGWDVTVYTAPREFFTRYIGTVDPSLEDDADGRIRVRRPGMGYFRWERDIRRYGRLRANMPVLANAGYNWTQRRFFPEHYASWIPRVVARALREHAHRRFDLVLATGNPFASFAAAWWLRRTAGLPYVLDYRDAWTFNQFTEEPKYPEGHPAWAWERRTVEGSALTVFVNEGLRARHAQSYPAAADRMAVVPNGWEPELLGRPSYPGPATGRPLRFGYVGTITEPMPLAVLFDGWRRAREHPELADATLDLHGHLGFFKQSADSLLDRIPVDEGIGVKYHGPLAKADVAGVYQQLDALVFCVPGARYVTSGKVFEYMATGRPIVSVHSPQIAAVDVLTGHPLWFGIDRLDAPAVADALVAAGKAARDLTEAQFDTALAHAERYTRANTLAPFEARLRELAGRAGRAVTDA